jgi:hypothetical protein
MNAQELAAKFTAKIAAAAVEKDRQAEIAHTDAEKRTADIEHCKRAMDMAISAVSRVVTRSACYRFWVN